jgi:hypothetical protein
MAEGNTALITTVAWKSFPLADDWPRSILAPAAVIGTCVLVLFSGFGLYLTILSFVFLFIALRQYFFPTYYELTDRGVRVRFLGFEKQRGWEYFRNYYPHGIGVYLTPLERPGALDGFRGQFVRFAGNRDEVLGYVKQRIVKREKEAA